MSCDVSSITEVMKLLYNRGLISIMGGNASVRYGDRVFITPSGVPKVHIKALSVLDLKGNLVEGPKPSIEYRFHLAIYRKTNAKAVLHAHPPHTVALLRMGIRPSLSEFVESSAYIKGYEVVDYKPPGSEELARAVEDKANDSINLIVLLNHGVIAWGSSLYEALNVIEAFEDLSKIYFLTLGVRQLSPQSPP